MLAFLIAVRHVVCHINFGGNLPRKVVCLIVLLDLLQRLADELVSRKALVGVGVSEHRLHTSANGKTVIIRAERVLTLGPWIREHVSSKAGLGKAAPSAI